MKLHYSVSLIAILFLSGCASLSEEECNIGDWQGLGYRDGVQGKPIDVITDHHKSCAKFSVKFDLDEYRKGREAGLRDYCVANNGYRLGLSGKLYNYVCPETLESVFLVEYEEGRKYYLQQKRVKDLDREISANKRKQSALTQQLEAKEQQLIKKGITADQRADMLWDIKNLQADFDRAKQRAKTLLIEYVIEKNKFNSMELKY